MSPSCQTEQTAKMIRHCAYSMYAKSGLSSGHTGKPDRLPAPGRGRPGLLERYNRKSATKAEKSTSHYEGAQGVGTPRPPAFPSGGGEKPRAAAPAGSKLKGGGG